MEVYDAIRTVLAVRKYQSKPVPAETVRKIVDAGRLSASARNVQPWQFIVVDDRETLQNLGSLARTGPYIAQAPVAIVVLTDKSQFGMSDTSRCIQNMVLTAWSEGVGSNWVGFFGLEAVKTLLGVPDAWEVFAILPLGYPADKIGFGKKNRKPFEEVVYRGKFGVKYG